MSWSGKKVLVTGAGGFIGSHLCEALLAAGADLTAMIHYSNRSDWGNLEFLPLEARRSLRVVAGYIEDSSFVERQVQGKDVVFHLAALIAIPYSYLAPASYIRVNVEGTLNVLEAARKHDISRVVHTSTSETYGTARYTPMDEEHPLQAQSPYSASKIGADKVAESYFRSFQTPVSIIRPFNTFGPRQSARAFIPTAISQALCCDNVKLGSLEPVRDLTFVKDTAQGFMAVAASEATVGLVTNVGRGEGVSVGDVAQRILTLLKSKKEIVLDATRVRPETSEVFTLVCDNRKARERTGWTPSYSLDQGLQETIAFIQEHPDLYRPERYAI